MVDCRPRAPTRGGPGAVSGGLPPSPDWIHQQDTSPRPTTISSVKAISRNAIGFPANSHPPGGCGAYEARWLLVLTGRWTILPIFRGTSDRAARSRSFSAGLSCLAGYLSICGAGCETDRIDRRPRPWVQRFGPFLSHLVARRRPDNGVATTSRLVNKSPVIRVVFTTHLKDIDPYPFRASMSRRPGLRHLQWLWIRSRPGFSGPPDQSRPVQPSITSTSRYRPASRPGRRIRQHFRKSPKAADALDSQKAASAQFSSDSTYGVYQIGLVYARSWPINLASSGISAPRRTLSYNTQRGVGISRIRA